MSFLRFALATSALALLAGACTTTIDEPVDGAGAALTDCNDYVPPARPDRALPTRFAWPLAPFDGRSDGTYWLPKEFNRVNPLMSGTSPCFGIDRGRLLHTGRDIFVDGGTEVRAPVAATVVAIEHEGLPTGASSDVLLIELTVSRAEKEVIAAAHQRPDLALATKPLYLVYRHLGYGSTAHLAPGATVAAGAVVGAIASQPGNSHLHLEARWSPTIELPLGCATTPMIAPGYFPTDVDLVAKGYLDPNVVVPTLASLAPRLACPTGCFLMPGHDGTGVLRANVNPVGATACAGQGRLASNLEGDKTYACDESLGTWTYVRDVGPSCP